MRQQESEGMLNLINRFMTFKFFAFLFVEALAWHLMNKQVIADAVWGWVAVAGITSFYGAEFGKEFIKRGTPAEKENT